MRSVRSILTAAVVAGIRPALSYAQEPPFKQQGPPPHPIAVEPLSKNVYWVRHVGFSAFITGDKGVIVLDTGGSATTGKQIVDAIAKVTSKPVNAVILTHGDGDHVGGIAAFPAGIPVIAQENTKQLLASASGEAEHGLAPLPADHPITHTVGRREEVTIDGVRLELLHWAPAHTSGDLVIYLPTDKLVFAGDVLVGDQHDLPLIHLDKGGSSRGWVETVRGLLALDATRYVIGHEAVVGKDVLGKELRAALAEREKVKRLYDEGKSLAQIEAAVGDPPADAAGPPHGPSFPPFSEVIYRELKAGSY